MRGIFGRGKNRAVSCGSCKNNLFFPSVCRIAGSHHPLSEPQLATWQPHATWCLFDLSPAAQLELVTKLKLSSYHSVLQLQPYLALLPTNPLDSRGSIRATKWHRPYYPSRPSPPRFRFRSSRSCSFHRRNPDATECCHPLHRGLSRKGIHHRPVEAASHAVDALLMHC